MIDRNKQLDKYRERRTKKRKINLQNINIKFDTLHRQHIRFLSLFSSRVKQICLLLLYFSMKVPFARKKYTYVRHDSIACWFRKNEVKDVPFLVSNFRDNGIIPLFAKKMLTRVSLKVRTKLKLISILKHSSSVFSPHSLH